METKPSLAAKEREKEKAGRPQQTHQPQKKNLKRAATRRLSDTGEYTSEEANLQQKMKMAAREVAVFHEELEVSLPPYKILTDEVFERYSRVMDAAVTKSFYCTPEGTVLYNLDGQWIKVTEESLTPYTDQAGIILQDVRRDCRYLKRVGWVLPRLKESEVAA